MKTNETLQSTAVDEKMYMFARDLIIKNQETESGKRQRYSHGQGKRRRPDPCKNCPYNKSMPCIGFCMKMIVEEMREIKKERRDQQCRKKSMTKLLPFPSGWEKAVPG